MTEFSGENYAARCDVGAHLVTLSGTLRLNGIAEYAPIVALLANAAEDATAMTLDLSALEFLNSSGIAVLSKFVIEARNRGDLALTIIGSGAIPWQGKSLQNLRRLMPSLVVEFR
ncbi:slr1659 superfamily regulator [Oleispirillum naphthae]|uniref:slr1659 superfamily regulator n=1 Tax=Oleispirillum naphthae TaxID=2838853 RepID=UPI0030826903